MFTTKKKRIPKFKTEDQERRFWDKHDSCDYIDYSKAKLALFPQLHGSVKTISIRLPESMIAALKMLAHKRDIPYQSLAKIMLAEKLEQVLHLPK